MRGGAALAFPLSEYVLLIGLVRRCNTLPDFRRDANKLRGELNHVSVPKACEGRIQKGRQCRPPASRGFCRLRAPWARSGKRKLCLWGSGAREGAVGKGKGQRQVFNRIEKVARGPQLPSLYGGPIPGRDDPGAWRQWGRGVGRRKAPRWAGPQPTDSSLIPQKPMGEGGAVNTHQGLQGRALAVASPHRRPTLFLVPFWAGECTHVALPTVGEGRGFVLESQRDQQACMCQSTGQARHQRTDACARARVPASARCHALTARVRASLPGPDPR